jgi:uncharacterized protein YuzE
MIFQYDAKQDALLVTFREDAAAYSFSQEVHPGFVIDYDDDGIPIGFDIYHDASKLIDIAALQRNATVQEYEHGLPRYKREDPPSFDMIIADAPPRDALPEPDPEPKPKPSKRKKR